MDAQDFALTAAEGTKMAGAMPVVENAVAQMEAQIMRQALGELDRGTLTPERALSLWQQLHAQTRLLRQMRKAVKMGQSAADALAQHLAQ